MKFGNQEITLQEQNGKNQKANLSQKDISQRKEKKEFLLLKEGFRLYLKLINQNQLNSATCSHRCIQPIDYKKQIIYIIRKIAVYSSIILKDVKELTRWIIFVN